MSAAPAHRKPWSAITTDSPDAPVGLMGIPFDDATSFRKGAAQAPDRIRRSTPFVAPITEEGLVIKDFAIRDYGDVERDLLWERYFETVNERAKTVLKHPFALFIGGDHSVSIPLIQAFSQQATEDFGVLHLDAHPDLADTYEGHPWSHACTERRVLEYAHMKPENLVFCGIRAYVEEEVDFLKANPAITVHSARSMHLRGIEAVAQNVIARLSGLSSIYLTLDIDCLDPAYAPGTGTPEAGGLTTRQLIEFLRLIFAALPIRAMDLVEVAPPLDYSDITTWAAIKVLYEVFGWVSMRKTTISTVEVNDVLEAFEVVIRFLEHYDEGYIRTKATQRFWDMLETLRTANNYEQQHKALLKIRRLMGGMGSVLNDFSPHPPANSDLSYAEADIRYGKLTNKLYIATKAALGEPLK